MNYVFMKSKSSSHQSQVTYSIEQTVIQTVSDQEHILDNTHSASEEMKVYNKNSKSIVSEIIDLSEQIVSDILLYLWQLLIHNSKAMSQTSPQSEIDCSIDQKQSNVKNLCVWALIRVTVLLNCYWLHYILNQQVSTSW